MILLGAIVNFALILIGGLIGTAAGRSIPERHSRLVITAIQLAVFVLGVKFASATNDFLLLVLSLIIGALIGETLDIDKAMNALGDRLQSKLNTNNSSFTSSFLSATLLYCVGSMAILASLESGIQNVHSIHYTKALMDGIGGIFLASSMGIGVAFSAVPVLIYQGILTLAASSIAPYATPELMTEMSASGGIVLMALSLNMMQIKQIKVANLIPALFMPILLMLTPWF
ncbi:MAG: DUF554 domain-containing protein [Peptostreptococcaceae bacterium]|nr:DUF554 domain-containing protein [Peptostreptococcaceae bacterium]